MHKRGVAKVRGTEGGGFAMFGFGKSKEYNVRLSEKEMKELTKNMSRKELKEFNKRQEQAEMDAFEDMIMYMEVFADD